MSLNQELAQALQEVKALKRKMEDKDHDLETLKRKQEHLLQKLKENIECPICLDVPRTGPMPVCPNGHFVCSKCKRDSCPTCRTDMGVGKSLLAVTILENIEHKCVFEECDKTFPMEDLGKHEAAGCPHRTVNCPDFDCKESVALSKLVDHLEKSEKCCVEDQAPLAFQPGWNRRNYKINGNLSQKKRVWPLHLYQSFGTPFAITPLKLERNFYFVVVMFASEKECSNYKIEMIVHEKEKEALDSELSVKFHGSPLSIDVEKEEFNFYCTGERFMAKIMNSSSNKSSFSWSFKITKNE